MDNRTTAMTGHQEHPGTGTTLAGAETVEATIEDIGRACGMKNIAVVNPYDIKPTIETLRTALESDEPWLIVSRAACPLSHEKPVGPVHRVDQELCTQCKACLQLGCPAIEWSTSGTGERDAVRRLRHVRRVCPSRCHRHRLGGMP